MKYIATQHKLYLYLYAAALHLSPRFGHQLGGTAVEVQGPCFDPSDTVMCNFGHIPTPGIYVDQGTVICVCPVMIEHGRIQVTVRIRNTSGVITFGKSSLFTSSK